MRINHLLFALLVTLGAIGFSQSAIAGIPTLITTDQTISSDTFFMTGLTVSNNALVTIEPGFTLNVFPETLINSGSGILVKSGGTFNILGPIEVDFFADSTAIVILNGPLGVSTVTMNGPTTVHVDLSSLGDADVDGLEEVQTEMVQMDLTGVSPIYGALTMRVSPITPTLGEIEEKVNNTPGVLDIPPFTGTGGANSFFDVFFEVDTIAGTLHNNDPKHMETMIFHKPPSLETYQSPDEITLFDVTNMPTAFSIGETLHSPEGSPKEIDFFPNSKAIVILNGPLGVDSVTMNGPTTVEVDLGSLGDTDVDGLEEVPTEMVQLDLIGVSPIYGPLTLRVSPTLPTLGEIEEKVNNTPGVLDLPPFTGTGGANSFFDIFFEVDTIAGTLHNIVPKHMETMIFDKPPKESVYQSPEELILYDVPGNPTAFKIGVTLHAPEPNDIFNVCVLVINGGYYPCVQFFISGEEGCPPDHYHPILANAYSIFLLPIPDPAPTGCGFGLVSAIPSIIIPMSQSQIDAWNTMTGLTIIPEPPLT
ncbi:MAG: hypothetical protein OEL81_08390 [Nitrosopumilus sp.]|nr:hypothetical protein [Nitrosopumilus sp.]MDH3386072.1 hypothetical protein [Nitrosopumilus sp.]